MVIIFYFISISKTFRCFQFIKKQTIHKIFTDPELVHSFDGGQKRIVHNLIAGIEEEIDFSFEKTNILSANSIYDKKFEDFTVKSITMPNWFINKGWKSCGLIISKIKNPLQWNNPETKK